MRGSDLLVKCLQSHVYLLWNFVARRILGRPSFRVFSFIPLLEYRPIWLYISEEAVLSQGTSQASSYLLAFSVLLGSCRT